MYEIISDTIYFGSIPKVLVVLWFRSQLKFVIKFLSLKCKKFIVLYLEAVFKRQD